MLPVLETPTLCSGKVQVCLASIRTANTSVKFVIRPPVFFLTCLVSANLFSVAQSLFCFETVYLALVSRQVTVPSLAVASYVQGKGSYLYIRSRSVMCSAFITSVRNLLSFRISVPVVRSLD